MLKFYGGKALEVDCPKILYEATQLTNNDCVSTYVSFSAWIKLIVAPRVILHLSKSEWK